MATLLRVAVVEELRKVASSVALIRGEVGNRVQDFALGRRQVLLLKPVLVLLSHNNACGDSWAMRALTVEI